MIMFDEEEDLPDFESEEAYQEWENQELVKHEKQLEIKKEVFDEFKFQTTKKPLDGQITVALLNKGE